MDGLTVGNTVANLLATDDFPEIPSLKRFEFDKPKRTERLTHYLFRFPAKFHPPVAKELLRRYTKSDDRVLDPFCGSGTLLLEAAVMGRAATGVDVDPLAVFVSRVKTHVVKPQQLAGTLERIQSRILQWERSEQEYEHLQFGDLGKRKMAQELTGLDIPAIPNIEHWFRRYVIVDLARILREIRKAGFPRTHQFFFELCFASIIRAASNADPVPVSGLEVTSHMKRRDKAGRIINPFALFNRTAKRAVKDMESYHEAVTRPTRLSVFRADATNLSSRTRAQVHAVITSPPYHGAVDYYRRHKLEMFWLGLTRSQDERLDLLRHYIGRPTIPQSHPFVKASNLKSPLASRIEKRMLSLDVNRANTFKHYCVAMRAVFEQLAILLPNGAPALFIVGHSKWNNEELNTSELFSELSDPYFALEEQAWYPVKNRYMSYRRHNSANIDREFILVFRRTAHE